MGPNDAQHDPLVHWALACDRWALPDGESGRLSVLSCSAAAGVALFERVLQVPRTCDGDERRHDNRALLAATRQRLLTLALRAQTRAPSTGVGLAVAVYRDVRRLLDLCIQAMTVGPGVWEGSDHDAWADIEVGWRMQASAMEAALTLAERLLETLPQSFQTSERATLRVQIRQARDLQSRAAQEMSWRGEGERAGA